MTILDTNVVSEIMRPAPNAMVVRWMATQNSEDLYTTSVTMGEVLYGIELLPSGKRQESLRAGAERIFRVVFTDRVLSFEARAAREFSTIASTRKKRGRPISELDAQIAAIARVHGAVVATRDARGFEGCGVRVVNPWEE